MIIQLKPAILALTLAGCLAACGENKPTEDAVAEVAQAEPVRTCESIRAQVVLLSERNAATNINTIVKIYDPKTVKSEPSEIRCSGRAMLSNAEESTVHYRAFQDADGEWLIEFNDKPFEK